MYVNKMAGCICFIVSGYANTVFCNCLLDFFFLLEQLKLLEKHSEYSQLQLTKILGEVWRTMPSKEKEKYMQQRKKLKTKYDEEMERFYQQHPDARVNKKTSSGTIIDIIEKCF